MERNPVFTVPYNGDPKLVDIIVKQYKSHTICMYGSFKFDEFGGGRAQKENTDQSLELFLKDVKRIKENGIDFNYVLNNTNLLNREFSPEYIDSYRAFIEKLISYGITTVTLSNPFFIELTKKEFPQVRISGSINLKARCWNEIKYALSIGCDELTLHYDINKNIAELKHIREKVGNDITLKLIPNDVYIMNCVWQKGHTRMQGAHSRKKDVKTPYFSYYRNKCVNIRNYYPEQIFKAMWIAPEHIKTYIDIGYNHFKLLDRLASTEWIINVLNAYICQKPMPNLENLLGTYSTKTRAKMKTLPPLSEDDNIYPIEKLEAVPTITLSKKDTPATQYRLNDSHPKESDCNGCDQCKNSARHNLDYPLTLRQSAIHNTREWQQKITKIEFIEKLNMSSSQRISYTTKKDGNENAED